MRRPAFARVAKWLDSRYGVGYLVPDTDLDAGLIHLLGKAVDVCVSGTDVVVRINDGFQHGTTKSKAMFPRTAKGWKQLFLWLDNELAIS